MSWDPNLYRRTLRFAATAHHGQTFPGTELPYLLHVTQVAQEAAAATVETGGYDVDLVVACALLHDTIEDTDVTFADVKAAFGPRVAAGVDALTKRDDLPKAEAMADSLARIREQPREVWCVKLADRITNLQEPPHYWTPQKCTAYHAEAGTILTALGAASELLSTRLSARMDGYATHCG